jgi:hypothetical protein
LRDDDFKLREMAILRKVEVMGIVIPGVAGEGRYRNGPERPILREVNRSEPDSRRLGIVFWGGWLS